MVTTPDHAMSDPASPASGCPLALLLLLPLPAVAQAPYATQVIAFNTNGNAGGGIFNPPNALGAPQGPLHVHSLGIGGDLTLGFSVPIVDGPGADFLVGENPFRSSPFGTQVFAEMMFVEVSSDGVHFATFPSRYFGAPQQPGPFGHDILEPVGFQRLAKV